MGRFENRKKSPCVAGPIAFDDMAVKLVRTCRMKRGQSTYLRDGMALIKQKMIGWCVSGELVVRRAWS